jgi:hypothetical protein
LVDTALGYSLSRARLFTKFDLYFVGASASGFPLAGVHRVNDKRPKEVPGRADYVSFLYGSCEAQFGEDHPPFR